MELSELKNKIISSFSGSKKDREVVLSIIEDDDAIFPFNEYEHLICNFMGKDGLTYNQYLDIRTEYISQNPYLWIFEISGPRNFGEKFAQAYIEGKCSKIKKPCKKIDQNYSGEYDLWLDGIKIEVKASRVVDSDSDKPLYAKALSRDTKNKFLMNFQQLKPQCCDVFIWLAVFRDEIVLWILSSDEVSNNALYSKGQHRGNRNNEGQLHINHQSIHDLDVYELKNDNLEKAIREASVR